MVVIVNTISITIVITISMSCAHQIQSFHTGSTISTRCMYIKHKVLTLKTYFPSALFKKNLYSLFFDLSSPTESLISISRLLRCCMGVNEREHIPYARLGLYTLLAGNYVLGIYQWHLALSGGEVQPRQCHTYKSNVSNILMCCLGNRL